LTDLSLSGVVDAPYEIRGSFATGRLLDDLVHVEALRFLLFDVARMK
jgi:hypothetical protein